MFGDILSWGTSSLSSSVKSCESSSLSNSSVKTTVLDDKEEQIVKDQIGIKEEEIDKQFEFKREEFIDIWRITYGSD